MPDAEWLFRNPEDVGESRCSPRSKSAPERLPRPLDYPGHHASGPPCASQDLIVAGTVNRTDRKPTGSHAHPAADRQLVPLHFSVPAHYPATERPVTAAAPRRKTPQNIPDPAPSPYSPQNALPAPEYPPSAPAAEAG